MPLVIGLDFGTAFTKVVVAESRKAYAVKFFPDNGQRSPHLLPGVFSIDENDYCQLGYLKKGKRIVTDLKMRLLHGDCTRSKKVEIIAYLALVFQHTRCWFLTSFSQVYQNYILDWSVNVGLPTDNFHDERLADTYRQIVHIAWLVSVQGKETTLNRVADTLLLFESEQLEEAIAPEIYSRMLHPEAISLFPEFVAQIAGYVRSTMRRDDLHVLIDVGAGTVDIAIFNVHREQGEDVFPIFAKYVSPMGVHINTLHRIYKSGYVGRWKLSSSQIRPNDKEFSERLGCSQEELTEIDKPFIKGITRALFDKLRYTKEKRYPLSRKWEQGVPVFLCGGGAKVPLYSDLVAKLENSGKPFNLISFEMPKPENLEYDEESTPFHRLSVAYGLSFDAFNIGELMKEEDVSDVDDSSRVDFGSNICTRCDGTGGYHGSGCRWCGGTGMTGHDV